MIVKKFFRSPVTMILFAKNFNLRKQDWVLFRTINVRKSREMAITLSVWCFILWLFGYCFSEKHPNIIRLQVISAIGPIMLDQRQPHYCSPNSQIVDTTNYCTESMRFVLSVAFLCETPKTGFAEYELWNIGLASPKSNLYANNTQMPQPCHG